MKTKLLKKLRKEAYNNFKIVKIEGKYQCYEWSCKFYRYEWNLMVLKFPNVYAIFDNITEAQSFLDTYRVNWIGVKIALMRKDKNNKLIQSTRVD